MSEAALLTLDRTKLMAAAAKQSIIDRMAAGEDVPATEILAMHKLELSVASAEAVERINARTRGRRGDHGTKAKARRATKARG